MITRDNIREVYKNYKKTPKSVDDLNIALLFDDTALHHNLMIDPDTAELEIGSIDPSSPFHTIPLNRVHAIIPFEEWVAIVLHSSIIFLNRKNSKVAIDIKEIEPTFSDRVKKIFRAPIAC